MLRFPCGQCCASFSYSGGQRRGRSRWPPRCAGGIATMTALAVTSPPSELTVRVPSACRSMRRTIAFEPDARTQLVGQPQRDLLGSAGEAVLLRAAFDVEHSSEPARRLDVAHGVQHRHLVRFATPGHPRHDRHQVARRRAGVQRAQPPVQGLVVEASRRWAAVHGSATGYPPADPLESPLDPGHVEQLEHRQPGNGAAVCADPAAPLDQVLAAAVGRHRLAAQLARQFEDGVLRRADECAAEVDRRACDRRGRRPARRPGHGPPARRRRSRAGPGPAPRSAPRTRPRRRRRRLSARRASARRRRCVSRD